MDMSKKYFVREIDITHQLKAGDNEKSTILEYYLIESDSHTVSEPKSNTVYGIGISKKENENYIEKHEVIDFSSDKNNTTNFINKLAVNTVTPIELPFILDDIVGT